MGDDTEALPHPCSILMRSLAVNIELDLESNLQQALHVSCFKVDAIKSAASARTKTEMQAFPFIA